MNLLGILQRKHSTGSIFETDCALAKYKDLIPDMADDN
jgi:hypothetical protein